jgi:DNA repair ATPase RecN
MKKLLLSFPLSFLLVIPLYTHAESASTTRASSTRETASSTEEMEQNSPDQDFTLCQQQAIETRDTQISESRSLYNTAMNNALTDRKNKEKTAIALTDKDAKKNAIKVSVDTYKNLVKKAQDDLTDARKIAWQTFEDNIETCRETQNKSNQETFIVAPSETETKPQEQPALLRTVSKKEVQETSDEGPSFRNVFRALKSLFD